MRALALAALVAGCNTLDASRPIALYPGDDLTAAEVGVLEHAAACWNLQFDTLLQLRGVHDPGQLINVSHNDLVCAHTGARTDVNLPVSISLCPASFHLRGRLATRELFRTILHELGHALNIRAHAGDPAAVMYPTETPELARFEPEDCALFYAANPNMPNRGDCGAVLIDWLSPSFQMCSRP